MMNFFQKGNKKKITMMSHDDMVKDIKVILDGAEQAVSDDCCIYRVPVLLRKLKEDAYTPKVISIGPFHHCGHPHLENMERYKLMYCKAFLERTGSSIDSMTRYIEGVELNIRCCYSETLKLSKEELVKVVLVDSGFIIELFWRSYHGEWSANDVTFLLKPWLCYNLRADLLLLENQLPFFVLDRLYDLSFSSASAHGVRESPSFLDLTFRYFSVFINRSNLSSTSSNVSISHFTDLIRIFHLQHPLERPPARRMGVVEHLPSASELVEAGVKLKVNTESKCLLDLRFSGRVLEIPRLRVEDSTELLFRNMVALEQCQYPYESYITDYVVILDFLLNTDRDVDVLVRNRILVNWLGDNGSVADMFNGLCKNITQSNNFSDRYSILCEDLNKFCSDPWPTLKATLKRDYCSNPWKTAASIAGILLLILTLLQSVCSVLQVVQQYNDSSKT